MSENYGGPAVGAVALNRALRGIGLSVRLIATDAEDRHGARMSAADVARIQAPGTDIKVFGSGRPFYLMWSWSMLAGIVREIRAADFVHIHGQYLFPHVAAYVCSRALRKPYGIQLHGSLDGYHLQRSRRIKWLHDILFGNSARRHARYIHAASDREAAEVAALVASERLAVISLGVDPPVHASRPANLHRNVEQSVRENRVLFLGRLARKKRPDVLIRAWAEVSRMHPGAVLIVAGPDDDLRADGLRELAEQLGVDDTVHLPGRVVGAEKSWLYQQCAVFVLPSENENFGLTVVEAMAAGAYVIGSRAVASMELVEAARSGDVLEGSSPATLAESLNRALASIEDTRAAGLRGSAFAAAELSWSSTARKLYQRIVDTSV